MADKKINLIGSPSSKRTIFFKEAADRQGIAVKVTDWDDIFAKPDLEELKDVAVKIDPPSYTITDLEKMRGCLETYKCILKKMDLLNCLFLNSPTAILNTLDKSYTKKVLMKNNIPVTDMIADKLISVQQLFEIMEDKNIYSVFIKPADYSGAAGIAALHANPSRQRMKLYTTCIQADGRLHNTKRVYISEDKTEIIDILGRLLNLGAIAERWYPKDVLNGKNYDLRVVCQFGRIEHIVVRQSKGPFTNLHINNQAADIKVLGLTDTDISGITQLCKKAVSLFDGLNVAGIDVMLDKRSRKPRIIEINGQGDLIYQDIYSENKIYKRQIEYLSAYTRA